jgi:hypothetical protein
VRGGADDDTINPFAPGCPDHAEALREVRRRAIDRLARNDLEAWETLPPEDQRRLDLILLRLRRLGPRRLKKARPKLLFAWHRALEAALERVHVKAAEDLLRGARHG